MQVNLSSVPDTVLIEKSLNGDESAYGQMVERYQTLVCSVAYSRCGDLGISEDLAQEAFVQAWKKLADLNDVNKFKSWICTIVRNLAIRSREQSTRNVAVTAARLDSVGELSSNAIAPVERIISAEQEQLVWQAIENIPDKYRESLILFYRERQSVARVAADLEISKDAVKQRLARGRKFLQEQLAATVAATLETSKPSKAFTGAVLIGISGVKAKTATAGIAATIAGKTVTTSSGFGSAFLVPFAQLPLVAWLFKTSLDESRSSRERRMVIQYLVIWMLALIPMVVIMTVTIPWQNKVQPPWLRGLIIPGISVLYYIPMLIYSRRMGKRIQQLRIEEDTATPLRPLVGSQNQRGGTIRLFLGSGLLVAIWPALMLSFSMDWLGFSLMLASAIGVSLVGARLSGTSPQRSIRVYAVGLGCISLVGIGILFCRKFMWSDSPSNYSLWFVGITQAMIMTQVILSIIVWKRVYGKPK